MTENLISAPVVEVQKFPPSVELENFQLKLLGIVKIFKKKNCQFNYHLKIENTKINFQLELLPGGLDEQHPIKSSGGKGSRTRRRKRRRGPSPTSSDSGILTSDTENEANKFPNNIVNNNVDKGLEDKEDREYLEKVKQLEKYIELLRRMIHRIGNENDQDILTKTKKLLDSLSNSDKRMPIAALQKIEDGLMRMAMNTIELKGGTEFFDSVEEEAELDSKKLFQVAKNVNKKFLPVASKNKEEESNVKQKPKEKERKKDCDTGYVTSEKYSKNSTFEENVNILKTIREKVKTAGIQKTMEGPKRSMKVREPLSASIPPPPSQPPPPPPS